MFNRREFLGTVAGGAIGSRLLAVPPDRSLSDRPNVILIYCDDLGYGDLGCYGSRIRTPNIDTMAREGILFQHFCSASPVCSPSRAALLTGRYPTRVGVPGVLDPDALSGLSTSEATLAQLLKTAGYSTMCIGKWHLGTKPDYLPTSRGFDEYFGIPYSNDMWPRPLMHNTEVIEKPARLDTLTSRYTGEAVRFISSNKTNPFFLYLAHTYPHIPLAASPKFRHKSPLGIYGDVVEELDWSVGEIFRALRENGLDQSTLVLFSSDNGPWFQGSPGVLRGRKGETFEGGVRVPFIARLPGKIPAGQVTQAFATTMDLVPTITRLCSAAGPANPVDGVDIWPLLQGEADGVSREVFLYFDGWELQCARLGRWKLHVSRYSTPPYVPQPAAGRQNLPLPAPELYDLVSDPEEGYDLAEENPDVVAGILARIDAMLPAFPDAVRSSWMETQKRRVEATPPGSLPAIKSDP